MNPNEKAEEKSTLSVRLKVSGQEELSQLQKALDKANDKLKKTKVQFKYPDYKYVFLELDDTTIAEVGNLEPLFNESDRMEVNFIDVVSALEKIADGTIETLVGNVAASTGEPIIGNTSIEFKTQVWKNPKPNVKNTAKIGKDMLVNIDGETSLCIVENVIDNNIAEVRPLVSEPGSALSSYSVKKVYPFYKVLPNEEFKRGDVILNGKNESYLVLDLEDENLPRLKGITKYRNTDINDKSLFKITIKKYPDGVFKFNGKVFTDFHIPHKIKEMKVSEECEMIVKHFGGTADDLLPKEQLILDQIGVALDHPLNVARKEWAYIWGPSGSGKTTIALEYAKSVGKEAIVMQGHNQLTADDFTGYNSITTGEYYSSLLRDAVENGKVLIVDEIDACNPNILLCLNGLKGKYFQFPDLKDGRVQIHEDFRFIGTANTDGSVFSEEYSSRNPLDKATLSRCKRIEYDLTSAELALRYGFDEVKTVEESLIATHKELRDETPRDIERMVVEVKIAKETEEALKSK